MRLATLRDGTRDGALIVVGRDGDRYLRPRRGRADAAGGAGRLGSRGAGAGGAGRALDAGGAGARPSRSDVARLGPPLPRAYEWIDGSAFLKHVRRVRKARGAEPPATLETDPLVYQGGSGVLLGPARRHPARRSGLGPRLRERGRA